jgi:processive 1,2-diacylglycerol beta-glucosyltransferase
MPKLYDNESGRLLGVISQADVDFLITQLEEESSDDQDYFVDPDTLDYLADAGASNNLLGLLRDAGAASAGIEIRWADD